jgi:hypothetical protein
MSAIGAVDGSSTRHMGGLSGEITKEGVDIEIGKPKD